jgi:hypothetical protein
MTILKAIMAVASLMRADAAVAGADQDAVRDVLMATFDKPEVHLVVDPVVVSSAHAIADWTQGATGGRARAATAARPPRAAVELRRCRPDGRRVTSMIGGTS